jgi:phosphate transport system substrate-binding protein
MGETGMQTLLEDLNSLPGVVGSMFCDAHHGVLSRAFPPEFDASALTAIASALSASTPELKNVTGSVGVLDLRYRDARVVIRPAGEASLLVLCDKSANAQEVLAFASVACKKFERFQNPSLTGPMTAPAVPVLGPSTPAAGTTALTVRGDAVVVQPPRRRTGTMVAVAAVALLLGAVAAYVAYTLWGATMVPSRRTTQPSSAPAAQPLAAAEPRHAAPSGPVQIKLRLSGADALAAELMPALASAYLTSQKVSDVEATRGEGETVVVRGTLDGSAVGVEVTTGGTAKGLENLLAGTADVAVAIRRVNTDERQKLSVLGTMTSAANEHVLGLDGIAVIVNKANSVAALNREQLASILSGTASDWSSFGVAADEEWSAVGVTGKGGPVASGVHVYLPDDRSGIPEVVKAAVLGNKPWAKGADRLPTYQAVADKVIADAGGIGIVPMPAVAGARAVPIAELDDPPLMPTAFTVASEDYFLTHRLYLYTAQASPNAAVSRFVDFALSTEGQALVKKAGFVELAVKAERRAAPVGAPPEYVRLTGSARRLSSTFRFEPGSSAFDSRAQVDLDRVVGYLRENDLNGNAVRVLGFADALGAVKVNQQLSMDRATQVAQAFAQRGIAGVTIAGLGSALPVADNATEDGRRRNRRVEIWVTR